MLKVSLLLSFILVISIDNVATKLFDNNNKQPEDLDIIYPKNIHNERGLKECQPNAACSILHKRYWYKLRVQRLCQCPDFHDCPIQWRPDTSDNLTMMINNRSQMKFCEPLDQLTQCEPEQVALKVISNNTSNPDKYNKNQYVSVMHQQSIASCNCLYPSYWKLSAEEQINNVSIKEYKCTELKKCSTNEFCAHIRADYFSSFYQCSCPLHHMCIFADRIKHNVTEVLFDGEAYKGVCKKSRIKLSKGRTRY